MHRCHSVSLTQSAGLGTACQRCSLTELAELAWQTTPSARFQKSPASAASLEHAHRSATQNKTLRRATEPYDTSSDASPTHSRTARRIYARVLSARTYVIRAALPHSIGEEKARGRGRLWRGRAVDAEDEEEGASAASYAVDASPPPTCRWPRRTRRRRTTSPASLDRGTRTTQTRTRLERRSAAAR